MSLNESAKLSDVQLPRFAAKTQFVTWERKFKAFLRTKGLQSFYDAAAIKIHNSQSLHHDPPPQIAYNTKRIGLLARRTVEPLLQRATVCCCYRKRVSGKYTLVLTNASGKFA